MFPWGGFPSTTVLSCRGWQWDQLQNHCSGWAWPCWGGRTCLCDRVRQLKWQRWVLQWLWGLWWPAWSIDILCVGRSTSCFFIHCDHGDGCLDEWVLLILHVKIWIQIISNCLNFDVFKIDSNLPLSSAVAISLISNIEGSLVEGLIVLGDFRVSKLYWWCLICLADVEGEGMFDNICCEMKA